MRARERSDNVHHFNQFGFFGLGNFTNCKTDSEQARYLFRSDVGGKSMEGGKKPRSNFIDVEQDVLAIGIYLMRIKQTTTIDGEFNSSTSTCIHHG